MGRLAIDFSLVIDSLAENFIYGSLWQTNPSFIPRHACARVPPQYIYFLPSLLACIHVFRARLGVEVPWVVDGSGGWRLSLGEQARGQRIVGFARERGGREVARPRAAFLARRPHGRGRGVPGRPAPARTRPSTLPRPRSQSHGAGTCRRAARAARALRACAPERRAEPRRPRSPELAAAPRASPRAAARPVARARSRSFPLQARSRQARNRSISVSAMPAAWAPSRARSISTASRLERGSQITAPGRSSAPAARASSSAPGDHPLSGRRCEQTARSCARPRPVDRRLRALRRRGRLLIASLCKQCLTERHAGSRRSAAGAPAQP